MLSKEFAFRIRFSGRCGGLVGAINDGQLNHLSIDQRGDLKGVAPDSHFISQHGGCDDEDWWMVGGQTVDIIRREPRRSDE